MAKYYATIAGLPNIGVDDRKLPFSSRFLVDELKEVLTAHDSRLLDILRIEEEQHFLIEYLTDAEKAKESKDQPSLFSYSEVEVALEQLKKGKAPKKSTLPEYFISFLEEFVIEKEEESEDDEDESRREWPKRLEDKLSDFYYAYAMNYGNRFVEEWSELNLNIKNVFAAFTSRKLGWNAGDFIVGNGEVEEKLRKSAGQTFGLTEEDISYLNELTTIQNESDITRRERMIDLIKWRWLEDKTFDKVFDVETLLAYYLQLCIIERWTELNEQIGEETFRSIVATLKRESNRSLEEFKRNQKK